MRMNKLNPNSVRRGRARPVVGGELPSFVRPLVPKSIDKTEEGGWVIVREGQR
jgi:hypothetical protein